MPPRLAPVCGERQRLDRLVLTLLLRERRAIPGQHRADRRARREQPAATPPPGPSALAPRGWRNPGPPPARPPRAPRPPRRDARAPPRTPLVNPAADPCRAACPPCQPRPAEARQ